ncbi:hypothetical protein DFH08DRAFT_971838 [Mycena albidolilacea]|uniref:1,3-beta-glucanosyltransferase n=1 Tax=Mycena albidolilacea TaxID=1033008 RepID=A0AAD6ZBZ5_9AGAR|nr:hypothetical protein DFH08DRAFT_971838 [Mycena albidolilacea]
MGQARSSFRDIEDRWKARLELSAPHPLPRSRRASSNHLNRASVSLSLSDFQDDVGLATLMARLRVLHVLNGSIDTTHPTNLLDQYIKIIDVFSIYDNIPVFHVGNEVLTADATNAAPFLKAVAQDIKAYFSVISISSTVLFGYADIDGTSSFRDAVSAYLPGDPGGAGKVCPRYEH